MIYVHMKHAFHWHFYLTKPLENKGKRNAKFPFLLYHAKILLFLLKYHWFLCKLHNKKTLIQRDASEIYHLYKIKVFILSFLHSKISMGYKDLSPAANLNPSNLCVFIEQMCITTQKFFKKRYFFIWVSFVHCPFIIWQFTPRRIKSFFNRSFKIYDNLFYTIFLNNLGMYNFCFICQCHVWIHHNLFLLTNVITIVYMKDLDLQESYTKVQSLQDQGLYLILSDLTTFYYSAWTHNARSAHALPQDSSPWSVCRKPTEFFRKSSHVYTG